MNLNEINKTHSPESVKFRNDVVTALRKIENHYSDVQSFAANVSDVTPFGNFNYSLQIAGPLYFEENNPKGDVYVEMQVAKGGFQRNIYDKYGFEVLDDNSDRYGKWYSQDEMYKMVDELDEIVIAIAGRQLFLVGPDEVDAELQKFLKNAERQKQQEKRLKEFNKILLIAFLVFVGGAFVYLFAQLS